MVKKYLKYLSYLFIPLVMVSLYFSDTILPYLNGIGASDQGLLLKAYQFISAYYKDADTMNILITLLVIVFLLLGIVALDTLTTNLIRRIKHPFLQFLKEEWFKLLPQKVVVFSFLLGIYILSSVALVSVLAIQKTETVESVDKRAVLVLGTNKNLSYNKTAENKLYTYRIRTALDLYNNNKAEYFVVSGDRTAELNYDETIDKKCLRMS
jgi:hypothetical protein